MHYIIGVQIHITNRTIAKIRPGMTSQQVRNASTGRDSQFSETRKLFDTGKTYTLARIYPCRETSQILYEWTEGRHTRVTSPFDTIKLAETFISEILGETLPESYPETQDRTD